MNSREIAAAIDEAESEAWTEALSSMRSKMDQLRESGPIGESVWSAMRDVQCSGCRKVFRASAVVHIEYIGDPIE